MSNRNKGGMTTAQKKAYIAASLEEVSADILDLLYRIVFYAESGLE